MTGYVHGYGTREQQRLVEQAEHWRHRLIADGTRLEPGTRLLEVGCGAGAVLAVLGPNGAGKSTLLRIMAGREEPSQGRADLAAGSTVGLLEQEPQLDESKDVRANVEDGVRHLRELLDRFN